MTTDSNIVNFETFQAKQKEAQKPVDDRLVDEIRRISSQRLDESLQRLLTVVDDELFKLSDKAETGTLQTVYFDAMRLVRKSWGAVGDNCLRQFSDGYDRFWKGKSQPVPEHPPDGAAEDGFALVENEMLEEELAVNTMIDKGNDLFHRELAALNKRFAALLHRDEIETRENPLAPFPICHGFASALKPLTLDLKVKLIVYKLFERVVLGDAGKLYEEVNDFLVQEGILPNLGKQSKRAPSGFPASRTGDGRNSGEAGEDDGADNQRAYLEVFQGMQSLLEGWRTQVGAPGGDGAQGGPAVDAGELLNALSLLQHPAPSGDGGETGSGDIKRVVKNQLVWPQPDSAPRSLGRSEEDIIDMVALIFDFILEDRNLPDAVKALIARLQIPVVKVGILEKAFFGRKSHPVRQLLNQLAQAGVGLDMEEGGTDNPVFRKIESTVTRILDEFEQDVDLFSELLDDFTAFMEKEAQRSRLLEERTRQTTQSKEQLRIAKRRVAYEIAAATKGRAVPAAVQSFLYNIWKDVLVISFLRHDKQPDDWDQALDIMDRLVRSVTAVVDLASRKEMLALIPPLLKAIRTGLEGLSQDPQQVTATIKELEACQVAHLSGKTGGEPGTAVARKSPDGQVPAVEIRDPELAEAIVDIKTHLPDISNFTMDDLLRRPGEPGGAGIPALPEAILEQARGLAVGEWVEFTDGKKRARGKLSWKSQVTSNHVFVDRKGAKVLDIAFLDLAERLSLGTARIIEGANVPLMDRAFGALMAKLSRASPEK
jgi:hypothetical protein